MIRILIHLFSAILVVFVVDQYIKSIFVVDGWRYYGECIDLILVYNKGVAFSMFAFLEEWLKYIQIALVLGVLGYILYLKEICYAFATGLMLGGAFSNIYDRFVHGGVVDMVYWHCGFDFAVFNFADVMIDVAVAWLLLINYKPKFCHKSDT